MTSVTFPSGVEVTGLEAEARCIQCHQGRASTVSVNQSIADAGLKSSWMSSVMTRFHEHSLLRCRQPSSEQSRWAVMNMTAKRMMPNTTMFPVTTPAHLAMISHAGDQV